MYYSTVYWISKQISIIHSAKDSWDCKDNDNIFSQHWEKDVYLCIGNKNCYPVAETHIRREAGQP